MPFLKDRYRGERGISLVESLVETDPNPIWLADLDGRLASVMIVQRKDGFGRLEISLLVTKPEFRRRDYARGLIHKAKRIAADSKVELVAYPTNDISQDLFISERFRLVPEFQSVEGYPMYRFSGTQIESRGALRHASFKLSSRVVSRDCQLGATLLHGGFARRVLTPRRLRSSYSSEYLTPELVHPVEGLDGNCNFSRTTGIVA